MLLSSNTPTLPLFTARGLPGMLAFLFSDPAVEVLKLAWELQSSSEPEDSSKKGTLLICVAFWKTDLDGQHVREEFPQDNPSSIRKQSNWHRPFTLSLPCPLRSPGLVISSLSGLRTSKLDYLVWSVWVSSGYTLLLFHKSHASS